MAYEMIVGISVIDGAKYAQYRAEMTPLLEAGGGRFRYDFEVARTLKAEGGEVINRLFVIQFPDRAAKERFFADPTYVEIRGRLFAPSVQAMVILAEYAR